ncbi:MAG: hypothetical protein A2167_05760 [Planctomycetes bacterium RBG_13_46_10]|nr:MAG: hypothetical protein A2167_05760 [Planctomycetes bacterium RBG_13_46_10]
MPLLFDNLVNFIGGFAKNYPLFDGCCQLYVIIKNVMKYRSDKNICVFLNLILFFGYALNR